MSDDFDLSGVSGGDMRFAALAFAAIRHQHDTYYEGESFVVHLIDVGSVCEEFGLGSDHMIAAAMLHDTVEDTDTTVEELNEVFGSEVAGLVDAVTDVEAVCPVSGRPLDRMECRRRTRAKTKLNRRGVGLKLCDRIANTRAGVAQIETDPDTAWKYLNGYKGEYPAFREDLYIAGEYDALWNELDRLYDILVEGRAA
jgi:(p)ppGpp synthase/HD superfamily hydrolase